MAEKCCLRIVGFAARIAERGGKCVDGQNQDVSKQSWLTETSEVTVRHFGPGGGRQVREDLLRPLDRTSSEQYIFVGRRLKFGSRHALRFG